MPKKILDFMRYMPPYAHEFILEAMAEAMQVIRAERFAHTIESKLAYDGLGADVCTSADHRAQQIYVQMIAQYFPGFGIVAEEEGLKHECTLPGVNAYFTIDPLDGTKAYVRGESSGVGTMLALVVDGQVVAAYVGDVYTKEVYYCRIGEKTAVRLYDFQYEEALGKREKLPLHEGTLLTRDLPGGGRPEYLSPALLLDQDLVRRFKNRLALNGGIGTWMMRLWQRSAVAAIIEPSIATPWDYAPIFGISKRLEYIFLRLGRDGQTWWIYDPEVPMAVLPEKDPAIMIIHRSRLNEIRDIVKYDVIVP